MNKEKLFAEALKVAQQEELRTGRVVEKVYILDGVVYLSKHELKEKMPDYTLVRSDVDEKFPSRMNTNKPKRSRF